LGTDGCAANNNLDMMEEMKIASLLQKSCTGDPTVMSAEDVFYMATKGGASLFNLNAGEIKEGCLANLLLVDLTNTQLIPNHNLVSNLVYSANGDCVDTTICNGVALMENRTVVDENNVRENVSRVINKIF